MDKSQGLEETKMTSAQKIPIQKWLTPIYMINIRIKLPWETYVYEKHILSDFRFPQEINLRLETKTTICHFKQILFSIT